jgi:hypothetical protein
LEQAVSVQYVDDEFVETAIDKRTDNNHHKELVEHTYFEHVFESVVIVGIRYTYVLIVLVESLLDEHNIDDVGETHSEEEIEKVVVHVDVGKQGFHDERDNGNYKVGERTTLHHGFVYKNRVFHIYLINTYIISRTAVTSICFFVFERG